MAIENKIILKSAFNKTPGMVYKIEPCADAYGKMPSCVSLPVPSDDAFSCFFSPFSPNGAPLTSGQYFRSYTTCQIDELHVLLCQEP